MSASILLERLDGVRESAPGKWRARCPAHDSKSLTLAVAEFDGRTVVKCFAGCEVLAVLNAVGLTFSALFDKQLGEHKPNTRSTWTARDVLDLVLAESHVVAIIASDFRERRSIPDTEWQRLAQAAARLVELGNLVRL